MSGRPPRDGDASIQRVAVLSSQNPGLRMERDRGDWGTSAQTRAMRIVLEAGIRINEALAGWAQWAHDTDIMTAEDFGTAKPDGEAAASGADGS